MRRTIRKTEALEMKALLQAVRARLLRGAAARLPIALSPRLRNRPHVLPPKVLWIGMNSRLTLTRFPVAAMLTPRDEPNEI